MMARRSREKGWNVLVRGCAALAVLFVGFALLQGETSAVPLILLLLIGLPLLAGAIWFFVVLLGKLSNSADSRSHKPRSILPDGLPQSGDQPDIIGALKALDWFQFEKLVARLCESKGFIVHPRGGAKTDGGIDLVVELHSAQAAVQCKHWTKWKCGPAVVRELIGAMTHEGFSQGFLVCGEASEEAKNLAPQHGISIIDQDGLIQWIQDALAKHDSAVDTAIFSPKKLCPKCGETMNLKTAMKGRTPGSKFWGCSSFPQCNQTLNA